MKSISKLFENQLDDLDDLESPEREIQILRIGMIEELKASNLYERMAELANDPKVKQMCLDISKEEKVHMAEFETMLSKFDNQHNQTQEEGKDEVKEKFS